MDKNHENVIKMQVKKREKMSFCSCRMTSKAPLCDGSHKGEGFEPYRVTFDEDKTVSICGCYESSTMPYCDGSHGCHP